MFTNRRANSLATRRVKQPWPKGRSFKLLALDGGGIRGVYTAELLRRCEEAFGQGQGLNRYFDMIAGTSTGGIIALGLGLGFSTSEIVAFYHDDGRKIFPPLPKLLWQQGWSFLNWTRGTKLDHEELEKALKVRFRDNFLGQSAARLIVPAFMMPETEIAVFKTDHHSDYKNDWQTPMWKVARATSAAPTYLKGMEHKESGKVFIDGGVWANNPVMVALVDAMTAYDLTPDQIEVLSVGTGNAPFQLKPSSVFGGLWNWREVIKAAMFLTTDNATAQMQLILGPERCLRLEPTGDDACIELDDYDGAFLTLPRRATADFETNKAELASFFETTVANREQHYSQPARKAFVEEKSV